MIKEMKYRIHEVEEVISEMDLSEVEDDIAEIDEDMQLVISGWYVNIPDGVCQACCRMKFFVRDSPVLV